ncbi:MAG: hypothetical protein WCJ40_14485 [Planctomycetota bacterium]
MISWMMIIGVLASASIWMEYQFKTKRYDRSAGYMLGAMIFMMLIIGATQLALMINTTRSSGMIDFHRLSPQSPRSLLFGFMIGGPIREYAIVLFAIPFLVMACILYGTPLLGLIHILVAILRLRNPSPACDTNVTTQPNPVRICGPYILITSPGFSAAVFHKP